MKPSKIIYVMSTNSIGVVLGEGFDTCKWYRTDCDGVRDAVDTIPLKTTEDVDKCKTAFNPAIAPSTQIMIDQILSKEIIFS